MADEDVACLAAALLMVRHRRKNKKPRNVWVREVFKNRTTEGFFYKSLPIIRETYLTRKDPLYIETMRMSPAQFDYLLSLVGPYLLKENNNYRKSIPPAERLAITLRYLASGDLYRSVSLFFLVGKSTVSKIVPETCVAIWKALQPIFLPPLTKDSMTEIEKDFSKIWNFPNCVGSLDGKHVQIVAPANSGSQFFNYKHFHSIVLMAACDACYKFTFADIGNYGRISDGGVFAASALGKALMETDDFCPLPKMVEKLDTPLPHCFVGDDAFPLKNNLMKPYPGAFLAPAKIQPAPS